ncbi:MAG: hypothetical protein KAY37_09975 [Phycisphaerae bacterium]|nr:hypothetical protein [Phycisphaerae bacterium]
MSKLRIIPIVLVGAVTAAALAAQDDGPQWLAVNSVPSDPARAAVLHSSDGGLEIAVTMPGAYQSAVTAADGRQYTQLSVPGCGATADEVGLPEMPFKGFFVEIPYGVDVSVELLDMTVVTLGTGYKIYPSQPPQPDSSDTAPPFEINEAAYATDTFFPAEPVVLDEPGFIRGRRVVFVEAFPLRYNPVTTELQAYDELRFNLVFSGGVDRSGLAQRQRLATRESEALAAGLILNYEPVALQRAGVGVHRNYSRNNAADYLIIVKDNLKEEIQPLADWKKLKGYTTKVVKKSDAGNTPTAIKNYIQNAYDTWDPAPSYVLLVGDYADIPPKWVYIPNRSCNSDIYYACLQGDDYYPDLAIGRLPVSSETDCTNVVNKILGYDRWPVDEDWYKKFLSAAYFQDDNNDSYADRHFMETSAHVESWLSTNTNMTTHTAWCENSGTHSNYYYRTTGLNHPHRFAYASPIPASVTGAWVTANQATTAISNTINNGVGHVLHRDHGSETSWCHPPFNKNDISNLFNGFRTPVVFSFNCQTGSFQRASGDCFCEAFLKKSPGGCAGICGATRTSYSGYNDLIVHGLYTCFWSSYDSTHTDTTYSRSKRLGNALNYAKYYMKIYEGTSNTTKSEFYMFHWFGDPDMWLRTRRPLFISIIDRELFGPPYDSTMRVRCHCYRQGLVEGAQVTVSHAYAPDYWTGVTDANGEVVFYNMDFTEPHGYHLTVVVDNYMPVEESLDMDGACCDDDTGMCQDYVPMLQCYGRWTNGMCGEMEPPCGLGACCYDDGTCMYTPEDGCTGADMVWLGPESTCEDCCVLECPPEAQLEAEPCGEDTNGGCDMPTPAFETIECDDVVCGTLWATGGDQDDDWYQLDLTDSRVLTVTLNAESPAIVGVWAQNEWGQPGCDNLTGDLAWSDATTPCLEASVTTLCLPPGTYYIYVAADADEGYPCHSLSRGNDYVLTVTCVLCPEALGACCDDIAGTCEEDVHQINCLDYGLRFLPGGACGDFDPACGSLGVCCYDQNGTCEDNVPAAYCQGPGVRFLPAPATCDDFDPPCGTLWGVCCGPDPGECTVDVFEVDCQEPGQHFLAAPGNCDDCDTAVSGVCCDDDTGTCTENVYEFNCRREYQRFLPAPATCDDFDPPCGPAWGACCDEILVICEDRIYEVDCQGPNEVFYPGQMCDDLEPPCGMVACCLPDGSCVYLTEDECVNPPYYGVPQAPGEVCTAPWSCCFGDGSCLEVDPICCDEMGGQPGYVAQCLGDSNGNGIDDACEDCNSNGVPDVQDIAEGTSEDCNTNGIPDECDIAAGTSDDCNTNGMPDECEAGVGDITMDGGFIGKIFELDPPYPLGSGSTNLETMRNGDYPPVGSMDYWRQYDTFHNGDQGNEDWMGYEFTYAREFHGLIFQEGMHFVDGGWFDEFQVQVRIEGVWTDVANLSSDPPYPGNNGVNFETFLLTFDPLAGDAIRIYGDPGGEANFIGFGEYRVLAMLHPTFDCNSNGVLDECDIADGTSQDANGNGIPDECEAPPVCPGDSNCDEAISWRDIDFFVAAMNDNVAAWEAMFAPGTPSCPFENNDVNGDGTVNWRDIDPFVALMNTTCP